MLVHTSLVLLAPENLPFLTLFSSILEANFSKMAPYFGLKGGWLTFWVTVACATDMTLFGYDQGVFGKCYDLPIRSNVFNKI